MRRRVKNSGCTVTALDKKYKIEIRVGSQIVQFYLCRREAEELYETLDEVLGHTLERKQDAEYEEE